MKVKLETTDQSQFFHAFQKYYKKSSTIDFKCLRASKILYKNNLVLQKDTLIKLKTALKKIILLLVCLFAFHSHLTPLIIIF